MGDADGDGTGDGPWPSYGDGPNGDTEGNGSLIGPLPAESDVGQFYQNMSKTSYGDGSED